MQDSFFFSLRMNKCSERVNGRHFRNPEVLSYAIPRCRPNSRGFFVIVASIVYAFGYLPPCLYFILLRRGGALYLLTAVESAAARSIMSKVVEPQELGETKRSTNSSTVRRRNKFNGLSFILFLLFLFSDSRKSVCCPRLPGSNHTHDSWRDVRRDLLQHC